MLAFLPSCPFLAGPGASSPRRPTCTRRRGLQADAGAARFGFCCVYDGYVFFSSLLLPPRSAGGGRALAAASASGHAAEAAVSSCWYRSVTVRGGLVRNGNSSLPGNPGRWPSRIVGCGARWASSTAYIDALACRFG